MVLNGGIRSYEPHQQRLVAAIRADEFHPLVQPTRDLDLLTGRRHGSLNSTSNCPGDERDHSSLKVQGLASPAIGGASRPIPIERFG